jgi:hypothetical protein
MRHLAMSDPDYVPPAWDVEMHPVQIAGFRKMSVAQKIRMIEQLNEAGIAFKVCGLRMKHPDWPREKLEREARRSALYAGT